MVAVMKEVKLDNHNNSFWAWNLWISFGHFKIHADDPWYNHPEAPVQLLDSSLVIPDTQLTIAEQDKRLTWSGIVSKQK